LDGVGVDVAVGVSAIGVAVGISVGAGEGVAVSGRAVGISDAVGDGTDVSVGTAATAVEVSADSGVSVAAVDLQAARSKVVAIMMVNRNPMNRVRSVIVITSWRRYGPNDAAMPRMNSRLDMENTLKRVEIWVRRTGQSPANAYSSSPRCR
jgi:hypothetical protein